MALLRNTGKQREALLSNYNGEEPYMPGGYDTPYDGEEPYLPDGYDAPYDDDGYADDYEDDYGYGDGYDDPGRYDDDYGYNEAYDEGDDYSSAPYYDMPEYEPEPEYPRGWPGEALRYLDENDWVMWLLLVALPPVGIWLLWRRRRFGQAATVALSAVSTLWLVILLLLLVLRPFRPRTETTITPQPVGAAPKATEEATPEPEATPAAVAELISPEEVDEANAVYALADEPYYHQSQECQAIPQGGETIRVSRNTAVEKGLMACPYCIASQYSDGLWDLAFVNAATEDRSNLKVFVSPYNAFFHVKQDCSDIGGDAHEVGLKEALLMAKTACGTCCPQAAMEFYCTLDGTYYHAKDDCSGMRNASKVTYAEARVTGKKRCPTCIGGTDETEEAAGEATGYYVYATPNGTYYHVNPTCSGMKNAGQVLLSDMIRQGRPPCPVCCPDAEATVFGEPGNPYYHSYATCSGMTKATQGILVNALAAGLTRCPVCWTTEAAN